MKCPSCGEENLDIHLYCAKCGAIVIKPVAVSDSQIEEAKRAIYSAVQKRQSTDRIVSTLWIFVSILIFIFIIAFAVLLITWNSYNPSGDYSISSGVIVASILPASTLSNIVLAILTYKLVRRQNEHFAREREFREGVMALIRSAAGSPQREWLLAREMTAMGASHQVKEDQHNPILWALAVGAPAIATAIAGAGVSLLLLTETEGLPSTAILFIPIILVADVAYLVLVLYLLYFLGNSMFEHDGRWNLFIHQARTAMSKLALPRGRPYRIARLPERSFVLYLVLAIFTGVFMYYWWYTLVKDPNEHFKIQWEFEDHVLSVIGQPLPFTSSASQQ